MFASVRERSLEVQSSAQAQLEIHSRRSQRVWRLKRTPSRTHLKIRVQDGVLECFASECLELQVWQTGFLASPQTLASNL
jgi:hypothetical protein